MGKDYLTDLFINEAKAALSSRSGGSGGGVQLYKHTIPFGELAGLAQSLTIINFSSDQITYSTIADAEKNSVECYFTVGINRHFVKLVRATNNEVTVYWVDGDTITPLMLPADSITDTVTPFGSGGQSSGSEKEIVCVDIETLMGWESGVQQIDEFIELSKRYANGEIIIIANDGRYSRTITNVEYEEQDGVPYIVRWEIVSTPFSWNEDNGDFDSMGVDAYVLELNDGSLRYMLDGFQLTRNPQKQLYQHAYKIFTEYGLFEGVLRFVSSRAWAYTMDELADALNGMYECYRDETFAKPNNFYNASGYIRYDDTEQCYPILGIAVDSSDDSLHIESIYGEDRLHTAYKLDDMYDGVVKYLIDKI